MIIMYPIMQIIIIGSNNPVKKQATLNGFQKIFPSDQFQISASSAPSNVRSQPLSNQETLQGAINRAFNTKTLAPNGDYWVGIEGGIEDIGNDISAYAWVVILNKNHCGKARTGTFILPEIVADLIRQGKELGEADDIVFNRSNSKQDIGAVGLLTGNILNRTLLYEQAVILALIPFINPKLFP